MSRIDDMVKLMRMGDHMKAKELLERTEIDEEEAEELIRRTSTSMVAADIYYMREFHVAVRKKLRKEE